MTHPDIAQSILIVEDEFLLRTDAVDAVEDAGFIVYEAANAAVALQILETHSDISVLFTDIQMPGDMDGLDLARTVCERWPDISIVIVSAQAKVATADLPTEGHFFSKPYLHATILNALRGANRRTREIGSLPALMQPI